MKRNARALAFLILLAMGFIFGAFGLMLVLAGNSTSAPLLGAAAVSLLTSELLLERLDE